MRYSEKFGIRILQGYGVTETSPILCVNTSMNHKLGTVGQLLPGIKYKLQKTGEVTVLHVKGGNVMKGYLLADNVGKLVPPPGGWHNTGDVVRVDEDGFFTIEGRAKRFAKIGGEMVSLSAVESFLNDLWPDHTHAVVALEDSKKGESLVLVTDKPRARRESIVKYVKEQKLSALYTPRAVRVVKAVPMLATGKTDYREVKKLAER